MLDADAAPWSIQWRRGWRHPGEDRLGSAVGEVLGSHPMARARQAATARRTDRQYVWQIMAEPELDPLRVVQRPDDDALAAARAELQSMSVPLVESSPLRIAWLAIPRVTW